MIKTEFFMLRMTPEERRMIEALASRDGKSMSVIVRQLIYAEAKRHKIPETQPKKEKTHAGTP
jgi:predicted DNA-binding protein